VNKFRAGLIAASITLAFSAAAVSTVAQDKSSAIKERQDFMDAQQKAVGAINAFAKGTGERQPAIDGANKLVAMSDELNTKLAALFPVGTSNVDFPGKTRTKPEFWQNMDQIKKDLPKLHEADVKLVEVVKTADAATVGTAMTASYRDTCNALCHNSYRAPEEKK
jgi:cytochrome c556